MVRSTTKLVAEKLLVASGTVRRVSRLTGRTSAILAFHNVIAENDPVVGDSSLHMRRQHFADFVQSLRVHVDIVDIQQLLNTHDSSALRVALTFDDAYLGAVNHALPLLAAQKIPATVFAAPGMLNSSSTWWDEAAKVHHGNIPDSIRDAWLDGKCAGRADLIRASMPSDWPATQLPESLRIADEGQLLNAIRNGPFTLASHTWSHVSVSALASMAPTSTQAAEQLRTELAKPLDWLHGTGARTLPMLAYPYGRYNDAAIDAARDAGYSAAFRVDGGAIKRGKQNDARSCFAIPRINVPAAMTGAGMLLRMSGLRG